MYGRFFSLTAVLNTSSFNFGLSRYSIEKISMYKFYSHNYINSKLFTNDRLYIYAYRTCVKYRIIKYIQRGVFSMNLLLVQLVWFLLNFQNYSLINLKKNKVGVWIGRFKMLLLSMGFKVFMEWQESQCMLRLFDVNVNTCTFQTSEKWHPGFE